jgi:DNA replication protein DnaC
VFIDDLMFMAMDQREVNLLFHLINDSYNQSLIILTSDKGSSEWGELLGDPAITMAILYRTDLTFQHINLSRLIQCGLFVFWLNLLNVVPLIIYI